MVEFIDIVILSRNSIVREGLSRILTESYFNVVCSTTTGENLTALAERTIDCAPKLILFDSAAEECDEENLSILQTHYPLSHVVMLSDRFDLKTMLQAFRLGVRAYIVKEISCDRLVGTLRLVAMGERVLPSQLADELQLRSSEVDAPLIDNSVDIACLSDREREILRWLMMGCPNKVISRKMEISEATVKVHVKGVLRKLSVKNRTQAAIWAANHGMRGRCYDVEQSDMMHLPDITQLPAPDAVSQFARA